MDFDTKIPARKTIRLQHYNYAQAGLYFVTICNFARKCIFGNTVNNVLQLNDSGTIALQEWQKTEEIRSNIHLHEFVILPNHLHGIIEITDKNANSQNGRAQRAPTLGDIIRGYKSSVTKQIKHLNRSIVTTIWQRNYYEHIIRNEKSYLQIVEYIQTKPQRWHDDTYYVKME